MSVRHKRQTALLTLLPVAVVLIIIMLLPTNWQEALAYQRGNGQWWEFFTAGWVHFKLNHGLSSIVGLVIMWLLFSDEIKPKPVWSMLLAAATMSVVFEHWLAVEPYVDLIVTENKGFSGALYGFFAWGATLDVMKRRPLGWILLFLVVIKVTVDAMLGEPLLTFSEVDRVAVMAHFGGVVTGVFCALISHCLAVYRQTSFYQ